MITKREFYDNYVCNSDADFGDICNLMCQENVDPWESFSLRTRDEFDEWIEGYIREWDESWYSLNDFLTSYRNDAEGCDWFLFDNYGDFERGLKSGNTDDREYVLKILEEYFEENVDEWDIEDFEEDEELQLDMLFQ